MQPRKQTASTQGKFSEIFLILMVSELYMLNICQLCQNNNETLKQNIQEILCCDLFFLKDTSQIVTHREIFSLDMYLKMMVALIHIIYINNGLNDYVKCESGRS